MAIATRIENGVAIMTAMWDVSGTEVCAAVRALYCDPRFKPGMAEIWDLRLARVKATVADIEDIVALGRDGVSRRGAGRTAIVAPSDLEFGLARMLEAAAETLPAKVHVFRSYDDGWRWLLDSVPTEEHPN